MLGRTATLEDVGNVAGLRGLRPRSHHDRGDRHISCGALVD
jgi:hypothetical protein